MIHNDLLLKNFAITNLESSSEVCLLEPILQPLDKVSTRITYPGDELYKNYISCSGDNLSKILSRDCKTDP